MLETVKKMLGDEGISICSALPLSSCVVTRRYLLQRAGITDGTVIIFAVPYYSEPQGASNISAYARPRDYHLYMHRLGERLLTELRRHYPEFRFASFSDHSPIDERRAAVAAGLGVIGDSGLLITKAHSSYVFLGEIITSAHLKCSSLPIQGCEGCGACVAACPTGGNGCLSEITQKKGALTLSEQQLISRCGSAWGCDICAEVCPHTAAAKARGTLCSSIPFFCSGVLSHITKQDIYNMTDIDFSERAYSWRGRETILRNLELTEKSGKETERK